MNRVEWILIQDLFLVLVPKFSMGFDRGWCGCIPVACLSAISADVSVMQLPIPSWLCLTFWLHA